MNPHAPPLWSHRLPAYALMTVLLVSTACAPALRDAPGAADIPRLEAEHQRADADVDVMVQLGAAYREAGRLQDARPLLERAAALDPTHAAAVLYLGLTLEDQGSYDEARRRYESYLAVGRSAGLKRQIENRLTLVRRHEMQQHVRSALAREAELAATEPQAGTVAVFPFHYAGADEQLRPLGRALAELLVTDLSQTDRLRVLERLQVQMLLDEIQLGASGYVDPNTAARSGRLLGAGRVVQGVVSGGQDGLELQAAVVRVGSGAAAPDPLTERDALQRLIELEKRLALRIYASMGIELTAAERERVNQRPTENVQALLAYGLGLEALDGGNFDAAVAEFNRAVSLDPGFAAARQQAAAASGAAVAVRTSTQAIAQQGAAEISPVAEAVDFAVEALVPTIGQRDAAAEALGNEGLGRRTMLRVILRRPQE